MAIVSQTLRALLAPRRAVPIAGVIAAIVAVEWLTTRSVAALGIDLGLCLAFCLVVPASWRALCSPHRTLSVRSIASHLAYVAIGVAVVAAVGVGLPVALELRWTYVVEPGSLGLILVLFLVGGWGLGRDIDLELGFEAERRRAAGLAIQAESAQLLAVRAQLDPHFLFNTLNAIAEWCREDPLVAERATLELARMLRTILEGIRKPAWPLAEEIALLRRLFDLYQARDSERYRLDLDVPEPLPEIGVPPLVLLPLFENAITHGPSAGHAGHVALRVARSETGVRVEMRNPGRFVARREGGEGIAMAEQRLALAYGDRARLSIEAGDEGTVTTVSFPLEPSPQGRQR